MLAPQVDQQASANAEWNSDVLLAERHPDDAAILRLPAEELDIAPRSTPAAPGVTQLLSTHARAMVERLNRLNLQLGHGNAQITSVELTYLFGQHPAPPLVFHRDNGVDSTSAVFIVSLRNGSQPTVINCDPPTATSDARCAASQQTDGARRLCRGSAAGAATYFPLHTCHARPTAPDRPDERRDVVAVHVTWSAPPSVALLRTLLQSGADPLQHSPASLDSL